MTKPSDDAPKGELVLYQTEDGRTHVEVCLGSDIAWVLLGQMAQNINLHAGDAP